MDTEHVTNINTHNKYIDSERVKEMEKATLCTTLKSRRGCYTLSHKTRDYDTILSHKSTVQRAGLTDNSIAPECEFDKMILT